MQCYLSLRILVFNPTTRSTTPCCCTGHLDATHKYIVLKHKHNSEVQHYELYAHASSDGLRATLFDDSSLPIGVATAFHRQCGAQLQLWTPRLLERLKAADVTLETPPLPQAPPLEAPPPYDHEIYLIKDILKDMGFCSVDDDMLHSVLSDVGGDVSRAVDAFVSMM